MFSIKFKWPISFIRHMHLQHCNKQEQMLQIELTDGIQLINYSDKVKFNSWRTNTNVILIGYEHTRSPNRSFNVTLWKNGRFAKQSIANNRHSFEKEIHKEKSCKYVFQYLLLSLYEYTRRYMCHLFKMHVWMQIWKLEKLFNSSYC